MSTYTKPVMSAEEVAKYNKDGYFSFNRPLFSEADFGRLKAIFEENLEKYGPDDLDVIHFRDRRLMEFLLNDSILDLVEQLIGPNIGLWSSHFICKPAKTGKRTPWHEDSSYWKGRISSMENILTIWLAIDKTDYENGAMGVIPGTHHDGFSNYHATEGGIFSTEIDEGTFDSSQAYFFDLQPNECSLHDGRIIHGAGANTSDRRRCGYTMRYFPTTSHVIPEMNRGHKIWLARGKDLGDNAFEPAVS